LSIFGLFFGYFDVLDKRTDRFALETVYVEEVVSHVEFIEVEGDDELGIGERETWSTD